jgi:hypothetical protein
MKKLLLITCLFLLSLTSNAQENTVKTKIDNFDSITAPIFADSIAFSAKTPYTFLKLQKNVRQHQYTYLYIPSNLTEQERKDQLDFNCDKCMRVNFNVYYTGANEDLEIQGTQRLVFDTVNGSFLDLYPTWSREFYADATKQDVLDDLNFRIVYKGNLRLYSFEKGNNSWTIRNY